MVKVINIPGPPGGKLVCEAGQTGIIKRNSTTQEIVAQCITPPKSKRPGNIPFESPSSSPLVVENPQGNLLNLSLIHI